MRLLKGLNMKKKYVWVTEKYKEVWRKNPFSGHEWREFIGLASFEVRGPLGLISRHKKFGQAEKAEKEWEDFYKKYPPPVV
jgi:hypothetical protein